MALEIPRTAYTGSIKEVTLGSGDRAVTVGGETCYPFYLFEGAMPHPPRIAMEVWDTPPREWGDSCLEPFAGVTDDPVAWAKMCVGKYGAEMIALQMISTDPNGLDRGVEEAVAVIKRVADAIEVPLIIWGTANHDKDADLLRRAAEVCAGRALIVGPAEEGNYKKIGAAAIAYHHTVAASSPIDINLAKQLNILLGNLGVPDTQLIMDPTVGSIGYGIEYSYSVMERIRMAGLVQQDDKLQLPLIANISREVWKTRETFPSADPRMGETRKRGILLEAMSAAVLLLAGADVLVMRHPEAIRLIRELVTGLTAVEA
jgi:acetyl-CoA decarbonylase/synthase, CODH/ACS complex subunit delta